MPAIRSQQRIIRRRGIIRQAPERDDDVIAVPGWWQWTRRLQRPRACNAAAPRGSRHNQAVMGSGTPSIEMARPTATTGGLGGERQPHGRGLVICTVQAQDQAPGGGHLLISQVSETTGQSHLSPWHPATAPRNRTTVKMSVIRDGSGMQRPDPRYGMTDHLPQSAPLSLALLHARPEAVCLR